MLAKSQRTTEFYLSKFVVKNFFYDILSSARIQTELSVLYSFKAKKQGNFTGPFESFYLIFVLFL